METSLNEPGTSGLSSTLNDFWAQWQNMGNSAGSITAAGQASVLIGQGQLLASRIAAGYTAAKSGWSDQRAVDRGCGHAINSAAQHIAALNKAILQTTTSGGNANELMDQRDTALTSLARLTGATTRKNADGTIDVYLGGSTLVTENTARSVTLAGSSGMRRRRGRPGAPRVDGQRLAGHHRGRYRSPRSSPPSPGPPAAPAASTPRPPKVYNTLATTLAAAVNTALATGGVRRTERTGSAGALLRLDPGRRRPVSRSSRPRVRHRDEQLQAGSDGAVADAVSQLGGTSSSPDVGWAAFVSNIGVQSQSAAAQASIAGSAASSAVSAQTSQSGVDLDEETTNLVTYQHAYQAAARVITTIDSMLDTLINHTGLTA